MITTFSAASNTASVRMPGRLTTAPGPFSNLAGLLGTWEERKRFRLKLEDMLRTAPHLIEDVGMTRQQVNAEIAKPFWRE